MAYEDNTINSKNLLARFAHRSRYKLSLSMLKDKDNLNLLDFGCGDGTFLSNAFNNNASNKYIGYEPYMESIVKNQKNISIYSEWEEVENFIDQNGKFDIVTCFEVLEHFSEERQDKALNNISKIMSDNGSFIISVPIEKGLPVIPKNIRRIALSYKGNEEIYTFRNIISSLLGIKPLSFSKIRTGNDYLSHMGFYFSDLEVIINKYFEIKTIRYSPFSFLPYHFNSQVFYEVISLDKKNI